MRATLVIAFAVLFVGANCKWADWIPFCLAPGTFPVSMTAYDGQVSLERYTGTWYEIARMPAPFQKNCACSQAEYGLNTEGSVDVHNSCVNHDGSSSEVTGKAYSKNSLNTVLSVYFNPVIGGAYWILDIDPDYQWVIVGEPCRKFAWVLARTKTMPADSLRARIETLRAHNYDTARLVYRAEDC